MNYIKTVAEFHEVFQHPILLTPQIPDQQRCELRVNLLTEELKEFIVAINNKDIVEVADALADLQYVLSGAILEFGLADKFEAIFQEVHRSNISKSCDTFDEARRTVIHYRHELDTSSNIVENNNKWLVYRNSDKKTLKSINYSPADIKSIIDQG